MFPPLAPAGSHLHPEKVEQEEHQDTSPGWDVQLDPERSLGMLDALGIQVESENGMEVTALCPMHEARTGKVDHTPSWNFNLETGLSLCWSCDYSANALRLVADVLELETRWGLPDWDAARRWIADFELDLHRKMENAEAKYAYRAPTRAPELVAMTEARLAIFDTEVPDWALDARKIDQEACTRYGVLWDPKEECWITPLRDPESKKLIGYQQKGQGNRYFRNRPPGMKKSQTLFGLDCFEGGRMIVVESPLDCLRLDALGYPGAVSTCGAKISDAQIELMTWKADEVLLALDNDPAGVKAMLAFSKTALAVGLKWSGLNYSRTDQKDVGDMKDREVDWAIEHAIDGLWGVDAVLQGKAKL